METKRITKHIDRLLLDPNNYRFIDNSKYKQILDDELDDIRVQQRTQSFLRGQKNNNVQDLIKSFTTNGFLDIDQIQVRAVGDKYLVLEGNRRVATLKYLYEEFKNNYPVGKLEESDFRSIDLVEIVEGEPMQHLVAMGLHHISGKKKWAPVNEAQLLDDLIIKHNKTEDEICDALGISKAKLRKSRRTLFLIKDYKASDYGEQFTTAMYSIFEAAISNPTMKNWIEWDDNRYLPKNRENTERFYTWISTTEVHNEDSTEEYPDDIKLEPIITQYRQVREVAAFIKDKKALLQMEESRSIAEGYAYSGVVGEKKLYDAVNDLKSAARLAVNYKEYLNTNLFDELEKVKFNIENLLPTHQSIIIENGQINNILNKNIQGQFSDLYIQKYRKLQDLSVKWLKQVNIFVGGNNMGKTTMLETFYLTSQLNDINAFLELEKYRGKFAAEFPSKWINKNFITNISINANFNEVPLELNIERIETTENIDKTGYLSTLNCEVEVDNLNLQSSIHLFSNKMPDLRYVETKRLCQAAFTSPYRHNEKLLHDAHNLAVTNKYYDKVIEFIQSELDSDIKAITLTRDDGENRFKVISKDDKREVLDITSYGEGLQRVFEIALLLGYCRNGILCIDEIDSALHKSLLIKFTEFIQKVADEFNVQVFLTTHSKECIDAFVKNEYPDDNLMVYALSEEDDKIVCRFLEGNKLQQLVNTINIDIR